ncbi:homeobox-leucine zipper protein HAT4-like isoform X2 [Henckelia pumila]|uniref:homeobox-leucine zipper protein HAT4-like isoform X2 n=1 Tax=Henckelia pumila TaxID=405737 RepID=UPI003C6DB962
MAKKDDCLGLSLSLRCPENLNPDPLPPPPPTRMAAAAPFPLNLFRSPSPFMQPQLQKNSRTDAFHQTAAAGRPAEPRVFIGGIDINRTLTVVECDGEDEDDEEGMVTSPNSTVSSLSGKRSEREENDGERGASSSMEIEEDGGDAASRKKLRLSKEQAAVLEETFKEHSTLNPKQKMGLAKQLNLRPRQVEVWFQNRRARTKLKQTEVDCEYLRRCCENLTEENRRLQKEVNDLRTLKLSPQFYANMTPPTTLTMCPRCEHVAAAPSHHQPPTWAAAQPVEPNRSKS